MWAANPHAAREAKHRRQSSQRHQRESTSGSTPTVVAQQDGNTACNQKALRQRRQSSTDLRIKGSCQRNAEHELLFSNICTQEVFKINSPSNEAAKRGPSNWIPQTWTSPAVKVASTARRILIPAFVAAMLVSGAMVACGSEGSEGPSSTSDTEQPAVVATAQQDQDGNQPDSRDAVQDRNGQQPSNDSDTPSSGDSDQPTDTPRPTPEPAPTDTPEPTPTPTMAPPPTRNPLDVMSELTYGHIESRAHEEFFHLAEHNNELIQEALNSAVADFITEEYPLMLSFYDRAGLENYAGRDMSIPDWERIPSDDGQLLIKITFAFEAADLDGVYLHEASVNGAFDLVSPPFENAGIPQPAELEAFTDQAPVFSHLVGELVVGPAQIQ